MKPVLKKWVKNKQTSPYTELELEGQFHISHIQIKDKFQSVDWVQGRVQGSKKDQCLYFMYYGMSGQNYIQDLVHVAGCSDTSLSFIKTGRNYAH